MKHGKVIAITLGLFSISAIAGLATFAAADQQNKNYRIAHNSSQETHGMRGKRYRGAKRNRGRHVGYLMKRFDTNEDRKLTQEELDQARKELLGRHDKNGDGKLTLAEFETLWLEFMRQRMVRGFQRIDRDGDAEITVVEFLEPYSRIVERLDRNEDGVLDKNDRRKRMKRHHRQERQMENTAPENSNRAN